MVLKTLLQYRSKITALETNGKQILYCKHLVLHPNKILQIFLICLCYQPQIQNTTCFRKYRFHIKNFLHFFFFNMQFFNFTKQTNLSLCSKEFKTYDSLSWKFHSQVYAHKVVNRW